MRALLIGMLVAGIVASPSVADARAQKITVRDGRAAIGRFLHREVANQGSAGFVIHRCGRLSARTVACHVTEYGIPDDLHLWGAPLDLSYPMRAQRLPGRFRVWSPLIAFG